MPGHDAVRPRFDRQLPRAARSSGYGATGMKAYSVFLNGQEVDSDHLNFDPEAKGPHGEIAPKVTAVLRRVKVVFEVDAGQGIKVTTTLHCDRLVLEGFVDGSKQECSDGPTTTIIDVPSRIHAYDLLKAPKIDVHALALRQLEEMREL